MCCQRLATAAMFLRSYIAQAPSCKDGPRHSIHAGTQYRKYDKGLIFFFKLKKLKTFPVFALEWLSRGEKNDKTFGGNS